jgi:hypothetical protein
MLTGHPSPLPSLFFSLTLDYNIRKVQEHHLVLTVVFWVVTPRSPMTKISEDTFKLTHSSATLITTYKTIQHHNTEDHNWHLHSHKNLKSQKWIANE